MPLKRSKNMVLQEGLHLPFIDLLDANHSARVDTTLCRNPYVIHGKATSHCVSSGSDCHYRFPENISIRACFTKTGSR